MTDTLEIGPDRPVNPPASGRADWIRRNLFASPGSAILTLLMLPLSVYVVYRLFRYVFVTGRWEIARVNLKLFLVGRYPVDELERVAIALVVIAGFFGIVAGYGAARRPATDVDASPRRAGRVALETGGRLWPLILGIALLLALSSSTGPWLTAGGMVLAAGVGVLIGRAVPPLALPLGLLSALVASVALVLYLIRTIWRGDIGILDAVLMLVTIGLVVAVAWAAVRARTATLPLVLLGVEAFVALIVYLSRPMSTEGWGGLMLNVFLAIAGITLCFPLGVLLALGRRSKLPVLRTLSVLYIELFRGVPLFVLLLLSYVALGLFWPVGAENPGYITRAIVVFTVFTAAYVAEIVRGGLQSLPKGQTEASQALGMSPLRTTGFIVLPQALRNVIPALVGQFISLFKDTTLAAAAMSLLDLLSASEAATAQPAFQGQNLSAESTAFVMLLFWIGCITMSRESQRLERKLGVGTR
ncbi:MAG: amino acid ABC transporter permease [Desertimonas sp.]